MMFFEEFHDEGRGLWRVLVRAGVDHRDDGGVLLGLVEHAVDCPIAAFLVAAIVPAESGHRHLLPRVLHQIVVPARDVHRRDRCW